MTARPTNILLPYFPRLGKRLFLTFVCVAGSIEGPWVESQVALAQSPPVGRPSTAANRPAALGTLVIVGGALRFDNEAIWSRIVRGAAEHARRGAAAVVASVRSANVVDRRPRIAVVAAASSEPQVAGQRIIDALEKYGAAGFLVPASAPSLDGKQSLGDRLSLDANFAAQVDAAHGVFFAGGAQARLLAALRTTDGQPTAVLRAISQLHARGGVIAGTSAGAAVMSRVMCREAKHLVQVLRNGVSKGKEVDDGFGFLDPNWFVDQHFLVRGRIARALVIMRQFGLRYGLGVDEETAVVVRGDEAEVVGHRGAMLIDLSRATQSGALAGFNLSDARVSYLDGGDRLNLGTLIVLPAADKLAERPIDPQAATFKPTTNEPIVANDILANTVFLDVMKRVMENRQAAALGMAYDGHAAQLGPTDGFEFRISRVPGTLAWATTKSGAEDWTITGMRLDVRPVTIQGPIVGK